MGQLAQATSGQQLQAAGKTAQHGIADMLKTAWPRIQAVMPKHMSSERMYQIALSAINTTPKLAECSPATILSCVMKCSALGLEPSAVDGLGRAYILPYRSKQGMQAQLILGYKGMIALARRSGEIKDISARAVYEGDEFNYSFGLDEKLNHRPAAREHEQGEKPTHVYMVAHFKDGGHYMDVMTAQEVEAIRKRSKAANNGPWVTDYEAMAKKTVIRRAFPYLPVSVEAMNAAASDDTDGGFVDQLEHAPIISE
jgi:recombination protein RecT